MEFDAVAYAFVHKEGPKLELKLELIYRDHQYFIVATGISNLDAEMAAKVRRELTQNKSRIATVLIARDGDPAPASEHIRV